MANQVTTLKMGQKFKQTPAGEIPVDWDLLPLGEVAQQSEDRFEPNCDDDRPYIGLEHIASGNGRLLGSGRSQSVSSLKTVFNKGDILFGKLRPNLKKIIVAPFDGVCSTDIIVIRPQDNVSTGFLFYRLQSADAFDFAISTSAGTKMPRTSWGLFKEYLLPLPPVAEQKKIAEILSSVDNAIEHANAAMDRCRILRKSLSQRLFTCGAGGHGKFKETRIGPLPNDWDLLRCEDICELVTVGIVIQPARLYSESGVTCLRSLNIHEDSISEDNLVFISREANEAHSKSKLQEGDVVAVRTGYPGTACVVPSKYVGANCVDLLILRPRKTIDGHFLSRFINSPAGRKQVLRTQGGLAQQHFNVGEAAKLLVPIPPMEEQQEIIRALQSIEAQTLADAQCGRKLDTLKKGLMHALLTGKLRTV